jgi:valyl-tRNA synthetase
VLRRSAGRRNASPASIASLASTCTAPPGIDTAEAERRRQAKIEQLRAEITRAKKKLGNEQFVSKAPPEVVQAERDKLAKYQAELEELESE